MASKSKTEPKLSKKQDGTFRASTRGKSNPRVEMASWRQKMRAKDIKFDDDLKTRYVEQILEHGKKALAAAACDISQECARHHLSIDPEFEAAVDEALEERSRRIVQQLEREALQGHDHPIFNKDGVEVGTKRVYETPLRLAMLKRFDADYKDRSDVNINHSGGMIMTPPPPQSLDDFEQEAERHRQQMLADQSAEEEAEGGK